MTDNQMDSESRSSLFKSLQRNTSLFLLRLNKSGIGPKNASDLADLLATDKHLKALTSLCDNSLNGTSKQIMAEKGLGNNETLQMFFLSHNPIGDEGPIHFTNFFMDNTVLEGIFLSFNEIFGTLPPVLGTLTSLIYVVADSCLLTGSVPELLFGL
jgi:Ran GTPase-activating protein (RanGAP) involved in mRNA processing and transport